MLVEVNFAASKLLVAKIELLPNSFKLHYFIGKSVTTQSQILGAEQTSASGPSPSSPFLNFGSNSLTNGGGDRDRTDDPQLAKLVLSQLSYAPIGQECI